MRGQIFRVSGLTDKLFIVGDVGPWMPSQGLAVTHEGEVFIARSSLRMSGATSYPAPEGSLQMFAGSWGWSTALSSSGGIFGAVSQMPSNPPLAPTALAVSGDVLYVVSASAQIVQKTRRSLINSRGIMAPRDFTFHFDNQAFSAGGTVVAIGDRNAGKLPRFTITVLDRVGGAPVTLSDHLRSHVAWIEITATGQILARTNCNSSTCVSAQNINGPSTSVYYQNTPNEALPDLIDARLCIMYPITCKPFVLRYTNPPDFGLKFTSKGVRNDLVCGTTEPAWVFALWDYSDDTPAHPQKFNLTGQTLRIYAGLHKVNESIIATAVFDAGNRATVTRIDCPPYAGVPGQFTPFSLRAEVHGFPQLLLQSQTPFPYTMPIISGSSSSGGGGSSGYNQGQCPRNRWCFSFTQSNTGPTISSNCTSPAATIDASVTRNVSHMRRVPIRGELIRRFFALARAQPEDMLEMSASWHSSTAPNTPLNVFIDMESDVPVDPDACTMMVTVNATNEVSSGGAYSRAFSAAVPITMILQSPIIPPLSLSTDNAVRYRNPQPSSVTVERVRQEFTIQADTSVNTTVWLTNITAVARDSEGRPMPHRAVWTLTNPGATISVPAGSAATVFAPPALPLNVSSQNIILTRAVGPVLIEGSFTTGTATVEFNTTFVRSPFCTQQLAVRGVFASNCATRTVLNSWTSGVVNTTQFTGCADDFASFSTARASRRWAALQLRR